MDTQITVEELIAQLQECPPDALVDVDLGADRDPLIAHDENLQVTQSPFGTWVTLRGF